MSVLAFDIGAGSGRALLADIKNGQLTYEEVHRFSNDPVQIGKRLHWDIYRIYLEIKLGLAAAVKKSADPIEGLAIDTWAVDFGLIGEDGELLRAPYHYRDHHTDGVMDVCHQKTISRAAIFERTGIQFLPFNTIYQLHAMKIADSSVLKEAESLLMIPDLLRYFLTGVKKSEFTNASTTQLYNPIKKQWDRELLSAINVPVELFQETVLPGTIVGELNSDVCEELSVEPIPVIAAGEHDTASAVAGIPALDQDFVYLSCGTWSLMGTEVSEEPIINEQTLRWNFTNEGGVSNTYRLLKNIMGLWILEECRRIWEQEEPVQYDSLLKEADKVPAFQSFIDPDNLQFLNPLHMPRQIQLYCEESGQHVPQSKGEIVRCIMEGLALKYRYVFDRTGELTSKPYYGLHMVGGGTKNTMLCQFTANALGKPVWAGPVEASAIGNIMVQMMALGKVKNLEEARLITLKSTDMTYYFPENYREWQEAYDRFCDKMGLNNAAD
ncbi:rhamnulokinase family protein [Alteribacillus sp. HJP-4]|uniref:rhamnulokinase n=1 Tax=Alteribacillus sp. HJP-4 TaxID=2775394 RepID=UPI0035CCCDB9